MQPIFKDAYYHRFSNIWFFVPILLLSVTVITMVSKGLLPSIMYYICLKIYLKSSPAPNVLLYIHMTTLKSLLKQLFSPSKILFIVEFSIFHDNFKFLSPGKKYYRGEYNAWGKVGSSMWNERGQVIQMTRFYWGYCANHMMTKWVTLLAWYRNTSHHRSHCLQYLRNAKGGSRVRGRCLCSSPCCC